MSERVARFETTLFSVKPIIVETDRQTHRQTERKTNTDSHTNRARFRQIKKYKRKSVRGFDNIARIWRGNERNERVEQSERSEQSKWSERSERVERSERSEQSERSG